MSELEQVIRDIEQVFGTFTEDTTLNEIRASLDHLFGSGVLDPDIRHELVTFGAAGGELLTPRGLAPSSRAILYLHGGGYAVCSVASHRDLCERLAHEAGASVLAVEYRLAPEHPFPAGLDDALAGYAWLLKQGYAAGSIAIAGDSAGGGLALATLLAIKDRGLARPGCAVLLSPWVDLELRGESMHSKAEVDPIVERAALQNWIAAYVPDGNVTNPLVSPLHGDLQGLPPLLVQVGEREALLDDARRIVDRAVGAGVKAELQFFEGQIHVFQIFGYRLEAARGAIADMGRFIRRHLEPAAPHAPEMAS